METKTLSLSELTSLWQESWDEPLPAGRLPAGQTKLGFYPITTLNVALDEEGRPVAYRGWSETNGYFLIGMGFTKEEHRGNQLYSKLTPPMRGKVIVGLSQRAKDFSPQEWINNFERKGFIINPNEKQVEEVFGENTPTTKAFSDYYSGKEGKAWAIKNMSSINKNERWIRVLTKNGYDIMDTKYNQRVNKTGLSKSSAKAMLEAIKRGETDLTEYESKVKRRSSRSNWRTILRKYLPDQSFDEFSLGEPTPDLGTRDRFKNRNIKSLGHVEHKAFVTEQYIRQVSDRLPDAGTSNMNVWLTKLNALNLSRGKYWFFGTGVYEDKTYVMIDVINKGDRFLDTSKKFNLEDMDSAIVFIGVSKSMVGKIKRGQTIPKGRKFIDIWGKGGVRGLQKKYQRKFPKEPKPIVKKWASILKIKPDSSFITMAGEKDEPMISPHKKDNNNPYQWSPAYNIGFRPHYDVKTRVFKDHPDKDRTDMMGEWASLLQGKGALGNGWFYINNNPQDYSYVTGETIRRSSKQHLEQEGILPDGGAFKDKEGQIFRNSKLTNLYILDSIRPHPQSYPKTKYINHWDIWGTGIKEGHVIGDSAGEAKELVSAKERAEQLLNEAAKKRNDRVKYREWRKTLKPAERLTIDFRKWIDGPHSKTIITSYGREWTTFANFGKAMDRLRDLNHTSIEELAESKIKEMRDKQIPSNMRPEKKEKIEKELAKTKKKLIIKYEATKEWLTELKATKDKKQQEVANALNAIDKSWSSILRR